MASDSFIRQLQAIVGVQAVLSDDESRERYSFDALGPYRLFGRQDLTHLRVDAVVRPTQTPQISRVMRLAQKHGVAVVPYAGGTGVMGGVIPLHGGIALDLHAMDRIIEIASADRLARVQPGVLLADLDQAAHRHGFKLGHDPWSVGIATVGGAISTDSVGYQASKYGSMGRQVRALEVVLADGSVVRTKPLAQPSSGPGIDPLFIGAEGTMGVITEATVQLFLEPESRVFATLGFESFEAGFPLVTRLFDLGLIPALIDLTEEPSSGGGQNHPCILYLGFEGYCEEVVAQRTRTMTEGLAAGGVDLGPGPTERYWEQRHDSAIRWREQVQPLRPTERWERAQWRSADYLHLALPVSRVLEYHRQAQSVAAEHGLEITEAAVWTGPGLYSVFVHDPEGGEGSRQQVLAQAVDTLLDMALTLGGGVEYCHGIGMKLDRHTAREWGDGLHLARRLKEAVDPAHILNPGKLGLG
jgi:FAD/FMN-containing dehydrogenase